MPPKPLTFDEVVNRFYFSNKKDFQLLMSVKQGLPIDFAGKIYDLLKEGNKKLAKALYNKYLWDRLK